MTLAFFAVNLRILNCILFLSMLFLKRLFLQQFFVCQIINFFYCSFLNDLHHYLSFDYAHLLSFITKENNELFNKIYHTTLHAVSQISLVLERSCQAQDLSVMELIFVPNRIERTMPNIFS